MRWDWVCVVFLLLSRLSMVLVVNWVDVILSFVKFDVDIVCLWNVCVKKVKKWLYVLIILF